MSIENLRGLTQKISGNANTILETLRIYFTKYLGPFLGFLAPLWWWVAGKYKTWYVTMAYKEGVHCTKRGARALFILTLATVASLYVNIWYVLPTAGRLVYDMVVFEVFSYKTEKMYFSKPEWIEGDVGQGDTMLSTFGCDARPCSDENSREYRFRDSLYLNTKYWITRAEPYDHSDIAGIMQSELNYCSVNAYGSRFKPLDWYPFIYKVECYDMPADQKVLDSK